MSAHPEYLRRNLIHAKALGARAGVKRILDRLSRTKSAPQWMVEQLLGIDERLEPVGHELARWRNSAPDAPQL